MTPSLLLLPFFSVECAVKSRFGPEQPARMRIRRWRGRGSYSARFLKEVIKHASLAKSFRVHDPFVKGKMTYAEFTRMFNIAHFPSLF
jgi:hypothetical protein